MTFEVRKSHKEFREILKTTVVFITFIPAHLHGPIYLSVIFDEINQFITVKSNSEAGKEQL